MVKAKKRIPWWGVVFIVLGGLVVLFGLLVAGLNIYLRGSVGDYYKASEKSFVIPDSDDDLSRKECLTMTGWVAFSLPVI